MRKIVLLVSSFFIFISVIFAQRIIENPEKPLSKSAGRIITVKEIMRIRDDGKKISFHGPVRLYIEKDESVYFYDNFKLYKYDRNGNFVFKIIEQGQGPGEANRVTLSLFTENEIIIQAWSPPKIMRFDFQGKYLGEKRTKITHLFDFLLYIKGKIYGFFDKLLPPDKRIKEGYVDFHKVLYEISYDFQNLKKKYSFPIRNYVSTGAWWQRARFDVISNGQSLFVTHTPEYKVAMFNLKDNQIDKIFKRKYKRVKIPIQKRRKERLGAPPPLKYYYDILKLLVFKDQLWVITSLTKGNGQLRLIDVFNMEGKYIDNFYLKFPKDFITHFSSGRIAIKDEYIYVVDQDNDGFFSIAKYKIAN